MAQEKIEGWAYHGQDYWEHKSLKDFCGKIVDWYFELHASVYKTETGKTYTYRVNLGDKRYYKGGFKTPSAAAKAAEHFAKKHVSSEIKRFVRLSDKVLSGLG